MLRIHDVSSSFLCSCEYYSRSLLAKPALLSWVCLEKKNDIFSLGLKNKKIKIYAVGSMGLESILKQLFDNF